GAGRPGARARAVAADGDRRRRGARPGGPPRRRHLDGRHDEQEVGADRGLADHRRGHLRRRRDVRREHDGPRRVLHPARRGPRRPRAGAVPRPVVRGGGRGRHPRGAGRGRRHRRPHRARRRGERGDAVQHGGDVPRLHHGARRRHRPVLRRRMSGPYDPAEAAAALAAADAALGALIADVGPCTLAPRGEAPFPYLLRSVVYQQLAGKAAATIHGRVLALFDGAPAPEALLALPEEPLRGAGLSRNKLAALRDLAEKTLDGTVPDALDALRPLPDDEVVRRLTVVRGIGPWTVEMLLIFNLGRPDVLPVTDLGVRNGFRLLHGLDAPPAPAALHAHGERWRPWRSVASWYLWRATDGAR